MTYKRIAIPGDDFIAEARPQVSILGGADEPANLIVRYDVLRRQPSGTKDRRESLRQTQHHAVLCAEITFSAVLEYRWVDADVDYLDQDDRDFAFGLIEVEASRHIQDMAMKGRYTDFPGERLGGYWESEIKHFRVSFDDWGTLDVIGRGVVVSEITDRGSPTAAC